MSSNGLNTIQIQDNLPKYNYPINDSIITKMTESLWRPQP